MFTLRGLAIVLTGAGVFAGLSLSAQACDNDRFPCPVASEALPQETIAEPAPAAQPRKKAEHPSRQAAPKRADTVAKPAPSAQPPKKAAKHLAPPNEKAQAKVEPAAPREATGAKASQPAVQEQAAAPSMFPNAAAPAVLPPSPADQGANSPNAGLVAAAGPVWSVLPNADAGSAAGATVADAAQAGGANAVQVVDPNDVNKLDQAAIVLTQAESSWITYVLLILGAAFAAAPAIWFVARMTSRYAPSSGSTHAHEQLVNEKVTYSQSRCRPAANADARLSEAAMIVSRQTRSAAKSGIRSSTIG